MAGNVSLNHVFFRAGSFQGCNAAGQEEEERRKQHVCKARKKPVLLYVRTEKSGGNMSRKIAVYQLPNGEISTETTIIPVTEKSGGKNNEVQNTNMQAGSRLNILA